MTQLSAAALKAQAQALGFNLVGITPATPSPTLHAYQTWIAREMHGSMNFMARPDRQIRRQDLNVILPGVQSLVVVGLDYRAFTLPEYLLNDPTRGRIAAYAWNLDYHDIMTPRLEHLAGWLRTEQHRVYVDTGAILERSHAQQAGLGFVGKNTMLINPRRGSMFFIGEILLSQPFDHYDQPHRATMCGNCTRCQTACPTNAFPQPYTLDARRCISYLTIENKGWIDRAMRPLLGNWIYGCDICQEVCPFQRFTVNTTEPAFIPPKPDQAAPRLTDILQLDEAAFKVRFTGSPIYRIKRERLLRNACVAAGNAQLRQALPHLSALLHDTSPILRGHAAWAIHQIDPTTAYALLNAHLTDETDVDVREEIALALN